MELLMVPLLRGRSIFRAFHHTIQGLHVSVIKLWIDNDDDVQGYLAHEKLLPPRTLQ